jgi:hypothetical protein
MIGLVFIAGLYLIPVVFVVGILHVSFRELRVLLTGDFFFSLLEISSFSLLGGNSWTSGIFILWKEVHPNGFCTQNQAWTEPSMFSLGTRRAGIRSNSCRNLHAW